MKKQKKLIGGKRLNRSYGGDAFIFTILAVFGIFFAFPLVFNINHAFKPLNEIFLFPPNVFVRRPTMNNFQDLFILMSKSWVTFSRYIFNTLFITVLGTVGLIIFASMGAFVVSKYKFPGSKVFFSGVIITLMFSGYVTAIPNYLVMAKLGWVDTYLSIIVPAFAMPMGFFLLKQFIDTIPDTLLEAAKIDGAKEFRIFIWIVMPLIRPAWLTVMIFSVQALWNARASNFIYSEELKTLPYALSQIIVTGVARAGVGAAVGLFVMIVPLVMFIFAQSNVLQTMASSGIKE
uniref:Binding-protein-dependent transport systems inner membrane component n=1 Tax=uncultured bacterium contig00073 TaxID=1181552 RepID=A0A806KCN4_9BACT|nr:binding-protein-dependent transport systems inner membrane component [uncultured bacterium contig00073]